MHQFRHSTPNLHQTRCLPLLETTFRPYHWSVSTTIVDLFKSKNIEKRAATNGRETGRYFLWYSRRGTSSCGSTWCLFLSAGYQGLMGFRLPHNCVFFFFSQICCSFSGNNRPVPGNYTALLGVFISTDKVKRPKARANKSSIDRGDDGANTPREGRGASGIGGKRPRAPSWEREYQQIWKSVYDLGAEQFTGKDKRAYEARKIVEMGGRVSANDLFFFFNRDLLELTKPHCCEDSS